MNKLVFDRGDSSLECFHERLETMGCGLWFKSDGVRGRSYSCVFGDYEGGIIKDDECMWLSQWWLKYVVAIFSFPILFIKTSWTFLSLSSKLPLISKKGFECDKPTIMGVKKSTFILTTLR